MTYRQLAAYISTLDQEQLEQDVTVYNQNGEFLPAIGFHFTNTQSDILDPGHPFITV